MSQELTLQGWLDANDVTKGQLGQRVGCSDVHIGRICKEEEAPVKISTELALKVFNETGIKVGPLRKASNSDIAAVARVLSASAGAAA